MADFADPSTPPQPPPPQPTPPPVPAVLGYATHVGASPTFIPNDDRARRAVLLLVVTVVATGVQMLVGLITTIIAAAHEDWIGWITSKSPWLALVIVLIYGLISWIIAALAIVFFLMWQYRAHVNSLALGASLLRFTPSWGVAWWFIPIYCLWRPYQVVREIYAVSDPAIASPTGETARGYPFPGWIAYWWANWIISGVLSIISAPLSALHGQVGNWSSFAVGTAGGFLSIQAAFQAMRLIREIQARQAARLKVEPV